MIKNELRKLRALNATREMMEKGKRLRDVERERYSLREHRFGKFTEKEPEYEFIARIQNLGRYIKMAVFLTADMRSGITTPKYEVFINREGHEWITRELDGEGNEVRWLTAMFDNLPGIEWYMCYGKRKSYFMPRDGKRTLNGLEVEKKENRSAKEICRLIRWQQEQKARRMEEQEAREKAPWDADMKLVPDVLPGFLEWMRRDVCGEVFIIYDYRKDGAVEGFCTRCRRTVPLRKPKINKHTVCPMCGAAAVCKPSGRIRTLGTSWYSGEMIQKIRGGIVVRKFEQCQCFGGADYRKPEVITREYRRVLMFDDRQIRKYAWISYKNKEVRWCEVTGYDGYGRGSCRLYGRNLAALKKTTFLKYSAADLWKKLPRTFDRYIEIERGNPAVEMLAKIGMFRLAAGLIDTYYEKDLLDQDATELPKILKIDAARLKRLKKLDGGIAALRWMQAEKEGDTVWPDEMIEELGKASILPSSFGFLRRPHNYAKYYRYLKKQAGMMRETLYQALTTWRDYICMAEGLKMDITNEQTERPKDVKAAHDRLVRMQKEGECEKTAGKLAKKFKKVAAKLQKLKKFGYEDGGYCIVVPERIVDIVMEGEVLGHCIHRCDYYFDRIQRDESYIFFLRKKEDPEQPWYTLEVEPSGNIRQKRTTGDKQNKDFEAAVPFLKKWQHFFKKQLTNKERQLGEKANELRLKNYKEIRDQQKTVWHGPLAGKLLADVLEADFMEAI